MIPKIEFTVDADTDRFVNFVAFGERVCIETGADTTESARRLQELKDYYERFLASRVIPKSGFCVDLGAGDGWFAVPFAMAFPDWSVICLETDPKAFARLQTNIQLHGLKNVSCLNAALHPVLKLAAVEARMPGESTLPESVQRVLDRPVSATFTPLLALAPRITPTTNGAENDETISRPALPVDILAKIAPDLLKLDAPFCEEAIACALRDVPVGFITGPLYTHVPSSLFHPGKNAGEREFYLPCRKYSLRRDYEDNFQTRCPRLDVVVAMYNTSEEYIGECIDSILADGNEDIRVIVVDDGSTDGCGDLVEKRYSGYDRVQLVRKANGGCASARNYGRQCSNSSHIAFIDADDRVDPGMFTALLETARYSGAFVTEAEFSFLTFDESGDEILIPSYEADNYPLAGDSYVGPYDFIWIPGQTIAVGQPTIWRRVHRRDFLDRKKIWFPEHVRAFDDQIFQLLISQHCGALAHLKGYTYHYRQHPAQDIKQGDDRHFYNFNMFRALLLRALDENWRDIEPLMRSLLNTMGWSYGGLRNDLKMSYQEGAAEFLAVAAKTFDHTFTPHELNATGIDGLEFLVAGQLQAMKDVPANYGLMRLESWRWQPEFIRMMQAVKSEVYV